MAVVLRRVKNATVALFQGTLPLWKSLGGIVVALALALLLAWLNATGPYGVLRYAALLLQIFGIGLVALGLSETRAMFGKPTLGESLGLRIRRVGRALCGKGDTVYLGTATAQAETGAFGFLTKAPEWVEGESPEWKMSWARSKIDDIERRMKWEHDRTQTEIHNIKAALTAEKETRTTEVGAVAQNLEEIAIGGIHLEVMGVVWLLASAVLDIIPGPFVGLATSLYRAVPWAA